MLNLSLGNKPIDTRIDSPSRCRTTRSRAPWDQDLQRARRITLQAWQERPWTDKLLDWAAGLLSSQL